MRIFTCTPVAFGGGADFFARDSGLLCRGLQSIGIDSRAVMPGGRKPEDEDDLIRTDYRNLESAGWWRSLELDGVVIYAWGRPKFRKVAAAIREAGIFLVLNQDSAGLMTPRAGFAEWLRAQWTYGGEGRGAAAWMAFLKLMSRGLTVDLLLCDPLRGAHLAMGDAITCVSPLAVDRYRRICRAYGGANPSARISLLPHAVEPAFSYHHGAKLRQVLCVGRWRDAVQKRAWLLMETAARLLLEDQYVTIAIAGEATPGMKRWHDGLPASQSQRVTLAGRLDRDGLREAMEASRVFYSPSAYESFGIAAAEALCCGCSVVAARKATLPSFEWFVSENSGRLADRDDVDGHVEALATEMAAWDSGQRDAVRISGIWCGRLHADKVALQVVGMMRNRGGGLHPPGLEC